MNRVEIDAYGRWVLVETDEQYDLVRRLRACYARLGRVVAQLRGYRS